MRLIPWYPHDAIPLEEPAPSTPVPATRIVTCVECRDPIPLRTADVVGLGFRCGPCGVRADVGELTGVPDVASHLSADDRVHLAARGRGLARRGLGIAAAVTIAAVIGVAVSGDGRWLQVILAALSFGLAIGGLGLQRWRRFR